MKKYLLALFLLLTLFSREPLLASHGMGGEISWECQGNGQYKFRVTFYRDCNGIPGPNSLSLTTTIPGIPSIPMPKISQEDITHTGLPASGSGSCPTCAAPGGSLGVVERLIYESALITINGVPPHTGWDFFWGECCRSGMLDNITNPGSTGFRLRARMYSTSPIGQNTNPCFDSSPVFTDPPVLGFCAYVSQAFAYTATDADYDSLSYEWANPMDDAGGTITWTPGYSVNSQLPSTTQNPANIPAVLNPATGLVTYLGYTGGRFVVCVKAIAWRSGYKTAEVFRDMTVYINTGCAQILGNQFNHTPTFTDPFVNSPNVDSMVVSAGDTVNFSLSVMDFDQFTNGQTQNISITSGQNIFGTGYTSTTGCLFPPCATFSNAMPMNVPMATSFNFQWVTSLNHIDVGDTANSNSYRYHHFTIRACDNYCPTNACATKVITIGITRRQPLLPPVLRCAAVNSDGSVTLNWSPTASVDTFNLFSSYKIYASLDPNGPFWNNQVGSVSTGISATTFTHSSAQLMSLFGMTAIDTIIYYRVTTDTYPNGGWESNFSNRIATMKPIPMMNSNGMVQLSWNIPSVPLLSSHGTHYRIWREYPVGSWNLIDLTTQNSYTDTSSQALCNAQVSYRIELPDTTGCNLVSSIGSIINNAPAQVAATSPPDGTLLNACSGQTITLTALNTSATYLWSTGQITSSIQVTTSGTYMVTVTGSGGCTGTSSISVNFSGSSPQPVITGITSICQGETTVLNAGGGYLNYLWSIASNSQTIAVSSPGVYTVTVTDLSGCTGWTSVTITVNPLPVATAIANGPVSFCMGDSVQLEVTAGFPYYGWQRNFGPVSPAPSGNTYYAKHRGNYWCMVTDNNGCSNATNGIIVEVPCAQPDPGVQKVDDLLGINIYPNPSHGTFTVLWETTSPVNIVVTDQVGKKISKPIEVIGKKELIFEIPQHGVYLLRVESGNCVLIRKIISLP